MSCINTVDYHIPLMLSRVSRHEIGINAFDIIYYN